MSVYNAPDAELNVFNPVDYVSNLQLLGGAVIGSGSSVDLAYIEANFLKFPTSQGSENVVGALNATSGISSGSSVTASTQVVAPIAVIANINPAPDPSGKGYLYVCNDDTAYPLGADMEVGGITGSLNSRLFCGGVKLSLNGITSVTNPNTLYVGGNATAGAINPVQASKLLITTDGTIKNFDFSPIVIGQSTKGLQLSQQCSTPSLTVGNFGSTFYSLGYTVLSGISQPSICFSQGLPYTDPSISYATVYCDTVSEVGTGLPVNYLMTENTISNGFRMYQGFSLPAGAYSSGASSMDSGTYSSNTQIDFGGAVIFVTINFVTLFTSQPNVQLTIKIAQVSNPLCIGLQFAVDSYTTASVGGVVYYTGFIMNVCNIRSGSGNTAGQAWGVDWFASGRIK
jgi:hypothetical protein